MVSIEGMNLDVDDWHGRILLRGTAVLVAAARHGPQAEVLPQGPAFVLGAKQPAALQFGDDHVDEVLKAVMGTKDLETVVGKVTFDANGDAVGGSITGYRATTWPPVFDSILSVSQ